MSLTELLCQTRKLICVFEKFQVIKGIIKLTMFCFSKVWAVWNLVLLILVTPTGTEWLIRNKVYNCLAVITDKIGLIKDVCSYRGACCDSNHFSNNAVIGLQQLISNKQKLRNYKFRKLYTKKLTKEKECWYTQN